MSLLRRRIPSIKFERMGVPYGGRVVEDAREVQQYDFDSNLPLFWSEDGRKVEERQGPNGERKPVLQLVVTVQTKERLDADDDGVRNIFVKSGLLKATRLEAGKRRIDAVREGMDYFATWTGETPPPAGRRGKPSKDYEVAITVPPPAPSGLLAGEVQPDEEAPAAPAPSREATREALDRMTRAHQSSPIASKYVADAKASPRDLDEPPF